MGYNIAMTQKGNKATKQAKGVSPISGVAPPRNTQFGQPNGNPRNNGGVPKRFLEIRKEIANLLDPNLTIEDYKKIYKNADKESGLRAVFAEAVVRKDIKTIFEMINQAHGKAPQAIDITSNGESLNKVRELTDEELDDKIRRYLKK